MHDKYLGIRRTKITYFNVPDITAHREKTGI